MIDWWPIISLIFSLFAVTIGGLVKLYFMVSGYFTHINRSMIKRDSQIDALRADVAEVRDLCAHNRTLEDLRDRMASLEKRDEAILAALAKMSPRIENLETSNKEIRQRIGL